MLRNVAAEFTNTAFAIYGKTNGCTLARNNELARGEQARGADGCPVISLRVGGSLCAIGAAADGELHVISWL
jgi:hypothetical protein